MICWVGNSIAIIATYACSHLRVGWVGLLSCYHSNMVECVYVCMCVCMCVCMYVCMYVCVYVCKSECDIRENFDTNECPNIFVSTKLHE